MHENILYAFTVTRGDPSTERKAMLGDRVRQRREELKLTQDQLAAATGLKQFHISRIESGSITDVKGKTLLRLAKALRVTSDNLLGREDEESEDMPAAVEMVGA
jgi:transcriptional regulator with XRE-family HTH domain